MNKNHIKVVGPFTFHPFDFTLDHYDVIIISVARQGAGGEETAEGENNNVKELCGHCWVEKESFYLLSFLHFCTVFVTETTARLCQHDN